MNITDVDDKIILAARQQYFLTQYIERHNSIDEKVLEETNVAFQSYVLNNLSLLSEDLAAGHFAQQVQEKYGHVLAGKSLANDGTAPGDQEAKVKMHLRTASSAAEAMSNPGSDVSAFYAKASGVLLPYLDSQYKTTIDGRNHAIFTKLTKEYEARFFEDMRNLNVQYPDKLTRVTEYGQEIVDYVKQIQDNGFAYEHEGSVYYDTKAWESSGGVYARLEPWSKNDQDLQADGEGALSKEKDKRSFKRSAADFALWKASRPGEPGWESPWGEGRPGWHIECSAMASDILGRQFDIHSGGIDLAFPHHDNELAQSEAYWAKSGKESKQWVNYFLHMGHLSIQGSKMSKSLKNFTTIREALRKGEWTPRGLRIAFLLGAWRDGLEITAEVINAGSSWEDRMNNFFLKARDLERNPSASSRTDGTINGAGSDGTVSDALSSAKTRLNDALLDSFDTPTAMRVMSDLVTAYNSEKGISDSLTLDLARWLTSIINVFGLDAEPDTNRIGWSGIDILEISKPYIYPIAILRDEVRKQAIGGAISDPVKTSQIDTSFLSQKPNDEAAQPYQAAYNDLTAKINNLLSTSASPKQYLALCDQIRDSTLWDLNIYLEDRENQPSLVRPLNASLRAERENRDALAALKLQKQADAKAKAEKDEKERLEKGKLSPLEMFRTSEYSAWDEEGMPVRDAEGKEVAKSRLKKLKKELDRQRKLHEDYLAKQSKS